MKNVIFIEQDDACFRIEDAETEQEIMAEKIIRRFNEQEQAVKNAALAAHPVDFSFNEMKFVGDVEKYDAAIANGMRGYSYTRSGDTETWITPYGTLVATFLECQDKYNKFQFEIF